MVEAVAITEAITDLNQAQLQFNVHFDAEPGFFPEWQAPLPELTPQEQIGLARLRDRYLYYAADGSISEGTINAVMISPLLELLGFFDPPYKVRGEYFVRLSVTPMGEDDASILRGRIDALVVQNCLWITLIEAKHFGFSVLQALPQTLAYMMANPAVAHPCFALITNGEDYLFVKLLRQEGGGSYGQSYKFTLLSDADNNLYRVARVLKNIALQVSIPML